ncbi:YgaP family membrane protein [Sedimenticola selenatireducens]|uniref:YgaP family membrane protein n=1 Tax=Sedimenticola selenatireducens TaxID=191960 RepID=UPI00049017B2|nr:DUF2892 domain-containing protein [Sedimenticola selenatireducens]
MEKNVSTWDRAVRVLLGVGLIGATAMGSIGAWGWVGVVPLATGLVGFCPLYRVCGCKSCATKQG